MEEAPGSKATFVTTSYPQLEDATTQRLAGLTLSEDGSVKGKVRLIFMGQEALVHRLQERDNDDTGRTKDLEDELRRILPSSADIHLDTVKGWDDADAPLDVIYSVEIPGYAAVTGKRLLISTALFEVNTKTPFVHETRVNPVYFDYPYRVVDQVIINVPASLQVESVPKEHKFSVEFAGYVSSCENHGPRLIAHRQVDVAGVMYPVKYYPQVKSFYEQVKSGDDETAVLRMGAIAQK